MMTSLAGECCGFSRDQMVYNLEYTHLHSLENRIFETLRPSAGDTFVVDHVANWFIHGSLDPRTFRRTLRIEGVLRPRYLTTITLAWQRRPPAEIYYVVYPNVDNLFDFVFLRGFYRVEWVKTFGEAGYIIPVMRMVLREPSRMGPLTTRGS
jgi:hypothetical protein